jgi:ADP-heptose:LPS heptosyltransferase
LNLLLIRLRLIGDVVFTTPAVRALRQALPDARITYLVEPPAAPVVRQNHHLDRVLVIERTRGLRRLLDDLRWGRGLKRAGYDAVIDFHGGPRGAWLTKASGAPLRIGYAVAGRRGVYTRQVERPRELRPRHSVLNQWDLIRGIAPALDRDPDPERDAVEMPLDDEADARVAARLNALDPPSDALVIVHVSAGNPFRRWPEEAFVALVAALAGGSAGRRIILTAGPSDRAATARVASQARRRLGGRGPMVLDWDDLEIAELHALVARAALFIGGDSGPLHVAATTRTPIVGIYGPTLAERSAPWRAPGLGTVSVTPGPLPCRPCEQRVCVPGDFRCLTHLSPARVHEAAERLLAGWAARPERHS